MTLPGNEDKKMLYTLRKFQILWKKAFWCHRMVSTHFEAVEKLTGLSVSSRSFKAKPTPDHNGVEKSNSSKKLGDEESTKLGAS